MEHPMNRCEAIGFLPCPYALENKELRCCLPPDAKGADTFCATWVEKVRAEAPEWVKDAEEFRDGVERLRVALDPHTLDKQLQRCYSGGG